MSQHTTRMPPIHQHASSTALWRAMHDVVLLQPRSDRARAQIDRIRPRAALRGVLQYTLSPFHDLWTRLDALLKTSCHRLVSPPLRPTESRTHCCSILQTTLSCPLLAEAKSWHRSVRCKLQWHHKHYCTTSCTHAHDLQRPVRRRRGGVRARTATTQSDGAARDKRMDGQRRRPLEPDI